MMTGSGVLPTEFFHVGSALGKTVLIGTLCCNHMRIQTFELAPNGHAL